MPKLCAPPSRTKLFKAKLNEAWKAIHEARDISQDADDHERLDAAASHLHVLIEKHKRPYRYDRSGR